MTPKYLAGRSAAQRQWIADQEDDAVMHARMAQHFEAANADRARDDLRRRLAAVLFAGAAALLIGTVALAVIDAVAEAQIEAAQ